MTERTSHPRPKAPPSTMWGWTFIGFAVAILGCMTIPALGSMGYTFYTLITTPESALKTNVLVGILALIFGLCPTIPILILSTWFAFKGWQHLQRDRLLRQHGTTAQGEIIDRWIGYYKGTRYYIAYQFQAWMSEGTYMTYVSAEPNRDAYHQYNVGDIVTIVYVPQNPHICRLA